MSQWQPIRSTNSARAVMSYAAEQDGVYTFALNRSATEHCKVPGARHEQDSCAMFHQLMYQLHGRVGGSVAMRKSQRFPMCCSIWTSPGSLTGVEPEGRSRPAGRRPETCSAPGITLDFGSGLHRYVAFERSASMSRQSRLSFIRADLYEPMRQRIMLNMELDRCQLSKRYAYNGLMFSSGTRVDGIRIDKNTGSSSQTIQPREWSEHLSSPCRKAESREPLPGRYTGRSGHHLL